MGAVHDTERRNVTTCARQPAQHSKCTNPYELVYDTVAGNEGAVFNVYMSRKKRPTSNNRVVADLTIMRGMGVVQLDTDERREAISPGEIEQRFVPFDELSVRIQARLASQVKPLVDQLLYDLQLN